MRCLATLGLFVLLASGCEDPVVSNAPPAIRVGIDRIEFGSVAVGDYASREIVIQNNGAGELRLDVPVVQDDPNFIFSIPVYDKYILPDGSGTLTVNFGPREVAHYEKVLHILSNDPVNGEILVILSGDGYRRGEIEVEPRVVDFGKVNAGSAGLESVTIRSVGSGDLLIVDIRMSDDTNPDFQIQGSTASGVLAPGDTVPIYLAYRPGLESIPPDEGRLIIESDDPFSRKVIVKLRARLNRAPVADAGPDQAVDPLLEVTLDGGESYDPDGDLPLEYSWSMVRVPDGSSAILKNVQDPNPTFTPDLVGVYEAELYVTDNSGLRSLLPDRVAITAIPAERLLIELVWDSPVADLDLHLLAPGGSLGLNGDCFWGNPQPDWGDAGDPLDDPFLKRDDLNGFGPETIGYNEPLDGVYRLVVDYYAAHTPSGQEPTTATLRIFVDGLLKAEISKRFEAQNQQWQAASVQWPEGAVEGLED